MAVPGEVLLNCLPENTRDPFSSSSLLVTVLWLYYREKFLDSESPRLYKTWKRCSGTIGRQCISFVSLMSMFTSKYIVVVKRHEKGSEVKQCAQ